MRSLLKLSNYIVVPDTYTLTIKEFKSILDSDKSKKKEKAMKEFAYIYYMCDHNSPFSTYDDEEKSKEILNNLGIDWKINSKVKFLESKIYNYNGHMGYYGNLEPNTLKILHWSGGPDAPPINSRIEFIKDWNEEYYDYLNSIAQFEK